MTRLLNPSWQSCEWEQEKWVWPKRLRIKTKARQKSKTLPERCPCPSLTSPLFPLSCTQNVLLPPAALFQKLKKKNPFIIFYWYNWLHHFTFFLSFLPGWRSRTCFLAKGNFGSNEGIRVIQNSEGGNYSLENLAYFSNPMWASYLFRTSQLYIFFGK